MGTGGVTPACVPGAAINCRVGFAAAGSWGPNLTGTGTPIFDHSAEMFQNGYTTDNNLTISGGNDRTTFFLSGGYNYDRGIVVGPNSKYQRISVRFNGSHRVFDNLKVGANVAYVAGDGGFVVAATAPTAFSSAPGGPRSTTTTGSISIRPMGSSGPTASPTRGQEPRS